jgi:hypothetical protein
MDISPKVIAAGLFSAVLQFALAVVAWGGWRPFFAHPALVALGFVTVALMVPASCSPQSCSYRSMCAFAQKSACSATTLGRITKLILQGPGD